MGLPSGKYTVAFVPGAGENLLVQYWEHAAEPAAAKALEVTEGTTGAGTTAIANAELLIAAPVQTAAPVASGTSALGQTLTCSEGKWVGSPTPTYSYQWLREGSAIAGATSATYVVQSADQGHSLACEVTVENVHGQASARSNSLSIPAAVVAPTAPPQLPVIASTKPQPPSVSPPPPPPPTIALARITRLLVSHGASRFKLACHDGVCVGTVEVVERILAKVRVGGRMVLRNETLVLAKGSYSTTSPHDVGVLVRLTSMGKRTLRHVRFHSVPAALVASVHGGRSIEEAMLLMLHS